MSLSLRAQAEPPKIIPGIETSSELRADSSAVASAGPLSKAARCAAIPKNTALPDECELPPGRGVLAVSLDGTSYLLAGPKYQSSCASVQNVTLERVDLVKGKLGEPHVEFKHRDCEEDRVDDPEACSVGEARAFWTALGKLAKAGYRDVPDLAGARMDELAGIHMAQPAAVLGAPLKAWMLYLKDERKRSKVLLVDPQNEKAIALGHRPCSRTELEADPDEPAPETLWDCMGSITHASLTADRQGLIVSAIYHDGGHCSSLEVSTKRYWLPKEAQAILDAPAPGATDRTPAP